MKTLMLDAQQVNSVSANGLSRADSWQCDLCAGTNYEIVSRIARDQSPLDTAICTNCGLVAQFTIPSDEQLTAYYSSRYREDYHGETEPSARRVMRAWKNGKRILAQLAPYANAGERVLEVGAGIGCTVKVFEQAGYDVIGLEPHQGFQRYSRETLRAPVFQGRLEDCPGEAMFDLVLLVHVIEHLNSPQRALSRIYQQLKPGAKLYVECPNLAAPFARPSRMFHRAHIFNFSPATLAPLAAKCGFRLQQIFSTPDDPNLQMLFVKSRPGPLIVDTENYRQTRELLTTCSSWSYHLRPYYLSKRVEKLTEYAREFLTARRFVADVLRQSNGACESGLASLTTPSASSMDSLAIQPEHVSANRKSLDPVSVLDSWRSPRSLPLRVNS